MLRELYENHDKRTVHPFEKRGWQTWLTTLVLEEMASLHELSHELSQLRI